MTTTSTDEATVAFFGHRFELMGLDAVWTSNIGHGHPTSEHATMREANRNYSPATLLGSKGTVVSRQPLGLTPGLVRRLVFAFTFSAFRNKGIQLEPVFRSHLDEVDSISYLRVLR